MNKHYQVGDKYYDELNDTHVAIEAIHNPVKTDLHIKKYPFIVEERGLTYSQTVKHYREKLVGTIAFDGYIDSAESYICVDSSVCQKFYKENPDLKSGESSSDQVLLLAVAGSYKRFDEYVQVPNFVLPCEDIFFEDNGQQYHANYQHINSLPLELFIEKKEGDHIRFARRFPISIYNNDDIYYTIDADIVYDIYLNSMYVTNCEGSKKFEYTLKELASI